MCDRSREHQTRLPEIMVRESRWWALKLLVMRRVSLKTDMKLTSLYGMPNLRGSLYTAPTER
jgi:hypothetical protein